MLRRSSTAEQIPVKDKVVGSNPTAGARDFICNVLHVIKSSSFDTKYIGSTNNLSKRIKEHNSGKCRYTKGRMPWKLIYREGFLTRSEAMKREKFLKSGQGRKELNNLLI